jgi:hypothetical protein
MDENTHISSLRNKLTKKTFKKNIINIKIMHLIYVIFIYGLQI